MATKIEIGSGELRTVALEYAKRFVNAHYINFSETGNYRYAWSNEQKALNASLACQVGKGSQKLRDAHKAAQSETSRFRYGLFLLLTLWFEHEDFQNDNHLISAISDELRIMTWSDLQNARPANA